MTESERAYRQALGDALRVEQAHPNWVVSSYRQGKVKGLRDALILFDEMMGSITTSDRRT